LALEQLRNQAFDAWLPLRKSSIRHARRVMTRTAPLFPSYLFVRMDVRAVRWQAINSTLGVKRLLCQNDRPVALPGGFVESLRAAVAADGTVNFMPMLKPGDRVEITAGPFARKIGELLKLDDRGRVAVLLELFSTRVPVRTTVSNLLPA
jgi:transcriptional antiterminator RfaH